MRVLKVFQRGKGQSGFTLLETLLSVTLFAIVMTSSFGVFSMGIQIWKRSQGRSVIERQAVLSLERMGRDIRNTLRVAAKKDEFGKDLPEYEGDSTSFSLPAVISGVDKYGKATTQAGSVSYRLNSNGELCRAGKTATDIYLNREPACRALVGSVKKLEFQYLLYVSFTKSYSWYDSWKIRDGLPFAIRVNLEIDAKLKGERAPLNKKYQQAFLIPVAVTSSKDLDLLPGDKVLPS